MPRVPPQDLSALDADARMQFDEDCKGLTVYGIYALWGDFPLGDKKTDAPVPRRVRTYVGNSGYSPLRAMKSARSATRQE